MVRAEGTFQKLRKEFEAEVRRLERDRKRWVKETPACCNACMRVTYCVRVPYNERISELIWMKGYCPDMENVWERICSSRGTTQGTRSV